jgi:hypothetical protein
MYVCPKCEQSINQASELCPYCGADLTVTAEPEEPKGKKRSWAKALVLWGLAIGFLWLMIWIALPLRMLNPTMQSESHALDALKNLHASLAAYSSSEGAYPPSLDAMGNSAARAAAQWALTAGYQLQYTPAQPGDDGRVHSYTLLARPSNYGFRSFFSDETGIVRYTREARPATAQDPPI